MVGCENDVLKDGDARTKRMREEREESSVGCSEATTTSQPPPLHSLPTLPCDHAQRHEAQGMVDKAEEGQGKGARRQDSRVLVRGLSFIFLAACWLCLCLSEMVLLLLLVPVSLPSFSSFSFPPHCYVSLSPCVHALSFLPTHHHHQQEDKRTTTFLVSTEPEQQFACLLARDKRREHHRGG